ncbi:MAG: pyruvate kinase [Candidatus Portiera sp.]|nr:pyruvate kinase [Portiera sp.]
MARQSKIIATLGPSTDGYEATSRLIKAGVDVVRLNMSHSDHKVLRERVKVVKKVATEIDRPIAILVDLQGPKIRVASFKNGSVNLKKGTIFTLVVGMTKLGDDTCVGVTYANLVKDCKKGDMILLDDGRITMKVQSISGKKVKCKVVDGGVLSNRKGLNKKGGGISAASITTKDKEDIRAAAEIGADYLAVSFVRSADDMHLTRKLLTKAGGDAGIIAKIETSEAVATYDHLLAIVKASDGAMLARGDLGVEIGETKLIGMQKDLIAMCRANDKISIIATQMMETMIDNPSPTRAEVSDVANAVLDGSDAVMLSGETAAGKHPHLVVETMARICEGADSYHGGFAQVAPKNINVESNDNISRKIARAAVRTATTTDKVVALVSLTESGSSALYMSRMNTNIPIYGFSRHRKTLRKMALYRDVVPVYFKQPPENVGLAVLDFMREKKLMKRKDRMVLTSGMTHLVSGGSNTMRVLEA